MIIYNYIYYTQKTNQAVWPCDENERAIHGERNARCGHASENKKRAANPKVERCV